MHFPFTGAQSTLGPPHLLTPPLPSTLSTYNLLALCPFSARRLCWPLDGWSLHFLLHLQHTPSPCIICFDLLIEHHHPWRLRSTLSGIAATKGQDGLPDLVSVGLGVAVLISFMIVLLEVILGSTLPPLLSCFLDLVLCDVYFSRAWVDFPWNIIDWVSLQTASQHSSLILFSLHVEQTHRSGALGGVLG